MIPNCGHLIEFGEKITLFCKTMFNLHMLIWSLANSKSQSQILSSILLLLHYKWVCLWNMKWFTGRHNSSAAAIKLNDCLLFLLDLRNFDSIPAIAQCPANYKWKKTPETSLSCTDRQLGRTTIWQASRKNWMRCVMLKFWVWAWSWLESLCDSQARHVK